MKEIAFFGNVFRKYILNNILKTNTGMYRKPNLRDPQKYVHDPQLGPDPLVGKQWFKWLKYLFFVVIRRFKQTAAHWGD